MSGLLALLDDVAAIAKVAATSVDDIAAAATKAGSKTAGVIIDDAAVTPKYRQGFAPARELPIVMKIARGSIFNKLVILLPLALLLASLALLLREIREHPREHELLDRVRVGARRVEHDDPAAGVIGHRYVVDARAGAGHGQEWAPAYMEQQITAAGRRPRMRTTLYRDVPRERRDAAFGAEPLSVVDNAPAGKRQRSKRLVPVATVLQGPGPLDRFNPVYEPVR